jgi:lysophospholipase L1-like esterase
MRRLVLRLILISLPLLGLVALEGVARTYFWLQYGVPGHSYGTSKYDPVMGAVPRENSYSQSAHLNDYGFRNSEPVFMPKPEGSLRMITYGGSTTFCHHLTNDQAWPIRLQALLREQRPGGDRDQVLNGGVVMWSLAHSFEKAKRDVPLLRPDAVIIYSGVNEIFNANFLAAEGLPMRDLVARGEYGRFTTSLAFNTPLRNVITYKFVRDRVYVRLVQWLRPPPPPPPPDAGIVFDPDVMTHYLETLKRFIAYLRQQGVTPVFVKEVYDPANPNAIQQAGQLAYSAQAATMVETWGAVLVDPTRAFADPANQSRPLFQNTGVHVTTEGAELLASEIYNQAFRFRAAGR